MFGYHALDHSSYTPAKIGHIALRMKKPASALQSHVPSGRSKGNRDAKGLATALDPWVTKLNFISYTTEKCLCRNECFQFSSSISLCLNAAFSFLMCSKGRQAQGYLEAPGLLEAFAAGSIT